MVECQAAGRCHRSLNYHGSVLLTSELSRTKKILFSLIPVTTFLLLLIGIEILLRMTSPSAGDELTTEVTYDNIVWHQINRSYLQKYFPANSPSLPEFKPNLFKKFKDQKVYRIFCLGESSMFGTPYEMTANIPGIVKKQLEHIYPDREFEVINWGASAINSNVVRDLSRQLIAYHPDLVLIYLGHNEFYGPDGIGASFIEKSLPLITQLKYRLRELRLVQLVQSWLRKRQQGSIPTESNLMKQVSQGNLVPLGSRDAQRIFEVFEENLRDIVSRFEANGVPVIVSDVSSNIFFPPFFSDTIGSAANFRTTKDTIIARFKARRYGEVLDTLRRLSAIDSTNGIVNYWLGRALLALGKTAEAKYHLLVARDNDLLKFRAPQEINEIIKKVCKETGVGFLSADSALSAASVDGVPGDNVFWEHLHPNAFGYYLIANGFVQKIIDMDLVARAVDKMKRGFLPFEYDSLSICWLDLAYADISIRHLTSRWPFQDYQRASVVLDSADAMMKEIVQDTYSRKLGWDEGCYKSAQYFWSRGLFRKALTTYDALLQEYPYNYYAHYLLGNLLNHTGRLEGAIREYRLSIRSNPQYPYSRLDLGLVEVNKGEFYEAIEQLTRARELATPQGSKDLKANILYGLAAAYANTMNFDTALSDLNEALQLVPNYAEAMQLRASILKQRRR